MKRGGIAVVIQPHQYKRAHVSIASARKRQPVTATINPAFQPLINAANEAIQTVIDERLFRWVATSHHSHSVRLENPTALHDFFHQGQRPPRFPRGGRKRFEALWKSRPANAQIEVTEFLTIISLRAR